MTTPPLADDALACLRDGPIVVRETHRVAHEPFTSGLSVDEFLLLERAQYRPIQLVSGSACHHLALVRRHWWANHEVHQLTDSLYNARREAVARLTEAAATDRDATGVAGVRLTVSFMQGSLARFIAVGTTVAGTPTRDPPTNPFICNLSGRELYLLDQAGWKPLALTMGCCVYHVGRRTPATWLSTITRNQEMPGYTEALYQARELAMARMQSEAIAVGAEGIVGVDVIEASHIWGSRIIEFFAIGTAVTRTTRTEQTPKPGLITELAESTYLTNPAAIVGQDANASSDTAAGSARRRGPRRRLTVGWRVTTTMLWLSLWVLVPGFSGQAPPGQLPPAVQTLIGLSAFGIFLLPALYALGWKRSHIVAMTTSALGITWAVYEIGLPGRHPIPELLTFAGVGTLSAISASHIAAESSTESSTKAGRGVHRSPWWSAMLRRTDGKFADIPSADADKADWF